jgi:hypothetical protein
MAELRDFGKVYDGQTHCESVEPGSIAMWEEQYTETYPPKVRFAVCVRKLEDGKWHQQWEYDTALPFFVEELGLQANDFCRKELEKELMHWQYSVSYSGKILCHERETHPVVEELKANVAFLGIF